jgi:hypothetical protein
MRGVLRSLMFVAAAAALMLAVGHLLHHYLLVGESYQRIVLF